MDESKLVQERKEKVFSFVKANPSILGYLGMALAVIVSIYIRTRGLPGLRDVTTGNWTLGPDLDPFLFLRWAKEILANGSLATVDMMRNVPLGFPTNAELVFHDYLIVWFHKVASLVGLSGSIEQSAVLFPVFFFALTCIFFFLFVQEISKSSLGKGYASLTAVIATFFLAITPQILPRTIAGIPEKESTGFFFLFLALYIFVLAWQAKSNSRAYIYAFLAGLATAGMALVWGGYFFITLPITVAVFIAFFFEKTDLHKTGIFATWLLVSFALMTAFSHRYTPSVLISSTMTLISLVVLGLLVLHEIMKHFNLHHKLPMHTKVPKTLLTLIALIILGIVFALILKGPSFLVDKAQDITRPLITPIVDRFGQTVAENAQPYFDGWANGFGPVYFSIPIFFWIFFIGSIYVFARLISGFEKRERIMMISGYTFFLFALIFSRYSSSSIFNGENTVSLGFYVLGVLALIGTTGYTLYSRFKQNNMSSFHQIDFTLLLLFSVFFFSIVSARGAVRLVMVLVPPASIIAAYFVVSIFKSAYENKEKDEKQLARWVMVGIVVILLAITAYTFFGVSKATAQSYIPSSYTQQWQYAMAWVRENTPTDAVFAHWWDYGYWVQSIGERATVLDGGNLYVYWDYLMGRHVLTTPFNDDALSFLYTHKATHLLIDSTDIGKYGAFSRIGSDENYDRDSFIPSFLRDSKQTIEKKNSTAILYSGGAPVDADIITQINGTRLFLPAGKAGIGGIIVEEESDGTINQPQGVFIYNGQQYGLPLRYAYYDNKLVDYGSGLNAGVFIFPRLIADSTGYTIQPHGAMLYLSNRTVDSLFARLYLYEQANPYFTQVHSEDDFIVKQLKIQQAGNYTSDFVYFDNIHGPIRIWQIRYPADQKADPSYLETEYPDKGLWQVN